MSEDAQPAAEQNSNGLEAPAVPASENGTAEASEAPKLVPPPAAASEGPSAEKIKAIEELKAAIKKAAAKPKAKKPETEELVGLCQCVGSLADNSEVFAEVKKILPRIGESHLVPLMGIKRAPPRAQRPAPVEAKPVPSSSQRVMGRVKSYNTRKGFGFIMVPEFPRDVFVYNSHLIGRIGLLAGEAVVFDLVVEGGRPQARNVKVTGDAPAEQENSAENLATIKKVIADQMPHLQPAPGGGGQSMREVTLAMAAAAAEVPTTMPPGARLAKSPEELLKEQIWKAQSEASSRQKPEAEENLMSDVWDGKIPRGSKVRVVEFPAPDVNGCTGIVKSYDAGSQRYQVAVESVGGEVVPMSLREEYMEVIGNEPPQAPSVPLQPPPPLSGGNSSQGLQKSAADALRRFGLGGPQQNQPQIPPFYQRDMNLEPEINRNEAARQMQARQQQQMVAQQAQQAQQAAQQAQQAAQQGGMPNMGKGMGMMRPDAGMSAMMGAGGQFGAPGAGPRGPGPNPQQARRPPMDMMRGPNKLGPEMGGNQPGPGQIRQPPMPPQAPQQMQAQPRPMQGNMQPRDDEARANYEQHQRLMLMQAVMDRETAERQKGGPPGPPGAGPPGPPGPPGPQSQMPAMPKQPPQPPAPKQQRKQPEISPGSTAPEGSRGAIWVVMKSQHFSHVIVRATQEVTSPELRRVLPGEAVTQRDLTETLPNGLVRMPVEPDGWVTVHARHINGPTFLAEASRHEPQQQRPNRGREAMAQPPPPPAEKKAPDYVRNAYSKETLLLARDHLINRGLQVPVEMKGLRSLMVPNMGDRKAGREHRKHRDQDRTAQAQDLEDDDEGREAEPPLPMPSREAPREVERPPPAVNNLDMTVRPKPAKVPKEDESPRGEEKKPNCPTQ